jgi:hypothetical protein
VTRQRVELTGRQFAALGLLVALVCAQGVAQLEGAPLWLAAVLALLIALALVLCALVVVVPLARDRDR